MLTLYLNTATGETNIALFEGTKARAEKHWPSLQNEAEQLQPAVEKLLSQQNLTPSDVQQLAVCIGPGGFTATRGGVSAANAWSFAKKIPVAAVTIFDLYPADQLIMISSNPHEAWIKEPNNDPEFITTETFSVLSPFSFCGLLSEEWNTFLKSQGGSESKTPEQLPDLSQLEFKQQLIKPWYYKDPHITWSKKNREK